MTQNKLQSSAEDTTSSPNELMIFKPASALSMRVFTVEEKHKLTKPSYQFLNRLLLWQMLPSETMEKVITQLLFSESRFVTLQETKWTIRNVLAEHLNEHQLAFLDLLLYQQEDNLPKH